MFEILEHLLYCEFFGTGLNEQDQNRFPNLIYHMTLLLFSG